MTDADQRRPLDRYSAEAWNRAVRQRTSLWDCPVCGAAVVPAHGSVVEWRGGVELAWMWADCGGCGCAWALPDGWSDSGARRRAARDVPPPEPAYRGGG